MLTDVKKLLETTGMKVAETCFLKPPTLPYIIFNDNIKVTGTDKKNCIANRDINIELYSSRIDREKEELIEILLNKNSIEYEKNRVWIDSEGFFQTVYDFFLIEKIGG